MVMHVHENDCETMDYKEGLPERGGVVPKIASCRVDEVDVRPIGRHTDLLSQEGAQGRRDGLVDLAADLAEGDELDEGGRVLRSPEGHGDRISQRDTSRRPPASRPETRRGSSPRARRQKPRRDRSSRSS